jgi:prophage DNA circulation protein
MDQDLIAYLDQRFEAIDRRFETMDQRFETMDQRFEKVSGEIRYTQITVEALRSDLQAVAEGVIGVGEQVEVMKDETRRELSGIQSLMKLAFADMDRRVRPLEEWKRRTDIVDPVAYIKEKFGKQS